MVVLLFSNSGQLNSIDDNQSKLTKIQQSYVDIACRYLNDQFSFSVGRRMFKKLVPLLIGKSRSYFFIHISSFFFKTRSSKALFNLSEY